jgi:hypothetical protein
MANGKIWVAIQGRLHVCGSEDARLNHPPALNAPHYLYKTKQLFLSRPK